MGFSCLVCFSVIFFGFFAVVLTPSSIHFPSVVIVVHLQFTCITDRIFAMYSRIGNMIDLYS